MNLQQGIPSRTTNGFNRRRFDREGGARMENKIHPGKAGSSNFAMNGGKSVPTSSLSSDRMIYISSCLIGHPVEVHVKNGTVFSGIFCSVNTKDFGIVLKMAQLIKDGSVRGQKSAPETNKRPQTMIIPARELVQIIAKDVPVASDEFSTANTREKRKDLMIDSTISRSHNVEVERELERWTPDVDDPECPELDNIFDGTWNRNWDQFEINEALFGVKSTFNEDLYTTKLVRGPQTREMEKEASRIAREIEGEETRDYHIAEERGMHCPEIDEESKYSAVHRQIDDGSLEENEDLFTDSCNTETFGGSISSENPRSYSNISWEKKYDEGKSSSTYSCVDEELLFTRASDKDANSYGTNNHSSSSTFDDAKKSINADDSSSPSTHSTDKPVQDQNGNKSFFPEKSIKVSREAHKMKGDEEKFFVNKKGLPSASVVCDPSSSDSENKDSNSRTSNLAPSDKMPVHSEPNNQFTVTSTSCISEHGTTDNGPTLSPSSSLRSSSSERSFLNPNAKEFKLNPNAKSFTPSFRPSAPMSEGCMYYTNSVPTVPPMQSMPMGVGIGPQFGAHQTVYNPQAPLQSSPYIPANGPMYGAQMIVGQPQPFYYMPTYPPDMQYRGRNF